MQIIKTYKDDLERQQVIEATVIDAVQLREDRRHVDGNFLVFSDEPVPPTSRDLARELDELKVEVQALKNVKAT